MSYKFPFMDRDPETAKYINDNINNMDTTEKKILLSKITQNSDLDRLLLQYAFLGSELVTPKENLTFEQCIMEIDKFLSKYHHKASGFYFDDTVWTKYVSGDKCLYELGPEECIYENTIQLNYYDEPNTIIYCKYLLKHLNNISSNFKITKKIIVNKKEKICIIHLHLYNINNKNNHHKAIKIMKK